MIAKGGITEAPKTLNFKDVDNDALTYTGEIVNGKANGKGVGKYEKGDRYEGYYKDNKRQGQGTYTDAAIGDKYSGAWADDKPNGKGTLIIVRGEIAFCAGAGKMEGTYKNGAEDGDFKVWNKAGKLVYEGKIANKRTWENYPNR